MKKTSVLIFLLLLSLTACSGGSNAPNDYTDMPPSLVAAASPAAPTSAPGSSKPPTALQQTSPAPNSTAPPTAASAPHIGTLGVLTIDITAENAYVINIDSDTVIYQKNSDEHIAPASTAKMLSAVTALDYCSLDDTVIVGSEIDMIASDSSRAWLNYGDTLTVKQLLVALLLPSGNDAAYTLAVNAGRKIAGDDGLSTQQAINVFARAMNQKAKEIGAFSSNFITPDGYDADGQFTTAADLAQIARVCLSDDTLSEIMGSYKISDTWLNGREVTYHNTNKLLNPESPYYYSPAVGLKTGSSGNAGACLVSAASINEQIYICVVMGDSAETRFSDSLTIYNEIEIERSVQP